MSDISKKAKTELLLVSRFIRENKEELKEILMGKSCGEAKDNVKEFDIDAAFKRVEERIEKLEKLCTLKEPKKSKPKTAISLIECFLDQSSASGFDKDWLTNRLDEFIRWLYWESYEIREKKS